MNETGLPVALDLGEGLSGFLFFKGSSRFKKHLGKGGFKPAKDYP